MVKCIKSGILNGRGLTTAKKRINIYSMGTINANLAPWMAYKQQTGNTYIFVVLFCAEDEVANYPSVSLGASHVSVGAGNIFSPADILPNLPMSIAPTTEFPNYDGSLPYWECPEMIYYDLATNPIRVSTTVFAAYESFPWDSPMCYMVTAYYRSDGRTPVPSSLANHEKIDLPDGSVYFMPEKNTFADDFPVVADRYISAGWAAAWMQWAFAYDGLDLDEDYHVWFNYTQVFPYANFPWVYEPDAPGYIEPFNATAQGYVFSLNYYSGGRSVEVAVKASPYDGEYYPPWPEVSGGGGIIPIVIGAGICALLSGVSLAAPWIYQSFLVDGNPFLVDGNNFGVK